VSVGIIVFFFFQGELEDGGGSGTGGSHWEKRIFMNEYMTGTESQHPIFSRLTMALFQDSGWYGVDNYAYADFLIFGLKRVRSSVFWFVCLCVF